MVISMADPLKGEDHNSPLRQPLSVVPKKENGTHGDLRVTSDKSEKQTRVDARERRVTQIDD